jgi:hypothetical protein
MGKLAYLHPEVVEGAPQSGSSPRIKSRADTGSPQNRGRLISPDGRRAPGARGATARPTSVLCSQIDQYQDQIPFFALRSVTPAEFSRIFAPAQTAKTILASAFTTKREGSEKFARDLYRIAQMAFEAGAGEAESAGVLLMNLEQDVSTRPTWDMQKGRRVDVSRLSGIEALPCAESDSVALARVPLTPDRVLCVIPPDSFRKIGWPDALHPVPANYIAQALTLKVIDLLLAQVR